MVMEVERDFTYVDDIVTGIINSIQLKMSWKMVNIKFLIWVTINQLN